MTYLNFWSPFGTKIRSFMHQGSIQMSVRSKGHLPMSKVIWGQVLRQPENVNLTHLKSWTPLELCDLNKCGVKVKCPPSYNSQTAMADSTSSHIFLVNSLNKTIGRREKNFDYMKAKWLLMDRCTLLPL